MAKLKSCGTLNFYKMKTVKKKSLKRYQGDTSGSEVKGTKGAKISQAIGYGIPIFGTIGAGIGKLIKTAKERKAQEKMSKRISNAQKVINESKNETLKEMEQMGQQKKGGPVMKKKMIKASKGVIVGMNTSVKKLTNPGSKGVKTGANTPVSVTPKAKYGMTMKKKRK